MNKGCNILNPSQGKGVNNQSLAPERKIHKGLTSKVHEKAIERFPVLLFVCFFFLLFLCKFVEVFVFL